MSDIEEVIQNMIDKKIKDIKDKEILSAREAASFLDVSRGFLYKKTKTDFVQGVHFHRKDGKIFFEKEALLDWVRERDTHGKHSQKQRPSVSEYLHKQTAS